MKILFAEDEEQIRRTLSKLLKKWYDLDVVENGVQAYKKLQETKYDAILTDIQMPKMTGLELCEKIRTEGNITPIIFITGNQNVRCPFEDTCEYRSLCTVLQKPLNVKELIDKLKEIKEKN